MPMHFYHYTRYIELISSILTIICLWLSIKQHIANWPLAILVTLMDLIIYHQGALYDRWLVSAISIAFSLYGWYQWVYGDARNQQAQQKIIPTSLIEWEAIVPLGILSIGLFGHMLIQLHSELPYQGATAIFLMMLGLWMTAHKKLETYIIWCMYSMLSMYVSCIKSYYWFGIKDLIALIVAAYGYYAWRGIYWTNIKCKHV